VLNDCYKHKSGKSMRIKPFLLHIIFLAGFGCATAQPLDTIFIIREYRSVIGEEMNVNGQAGHFPMEVYLPNQQQVTLHGKGKKRKKPNVRVFGMVPSSMHGLRIIKHHDSSLTIRIVTKDSIGRKRKGQLTVDTTLTIKAISFYENILAPSYGYDGNNPFRRRARLYISNSPRHLGFLQLRKSKRDKYLKWFLQNIQYEYNAVTGQLTQLY
jgi:hypothetical protein